MGQVETCLILCDKNLFKASLNRFGHVWCIIWIETIIFFENFENWVFWVHTRYFDHFGNWFLNFVSLDIFYKVQIFWEGRKIWSNLPLFWRYLSSSFKGKGKIILNFCDLLRISGIYLQKRLQKYFLKIWF